MIVRVAISGQELYWHSAPPRLASDSVNQVVFEFLPSSDWDGFAMVAQFTQNGNTYNQVVKDGHAKMPVEIGVGKLELSVFGTSGSESRNTVVALETVVRQSGFKSDGQTPIPPTPDLYDQLLQRIDAASGEASESAEAAAESADKATKSAQAAAASEQNAAESAESAEKSASLAQQSIQNAGWIDVYGEDGILYMVRSENAPEDFRLADNGKGVLEAIYG